MDDKYYKFKLSFKGDLVENSIDANAVANTILATSQILNGIAEINYSSETANNIKININAFRKGSFVSEFLIYADMAKDAAGPILPLLPDSVNYGLELIKIFKTVINIRQKLKGKPPKSVEVSGDGNVVINGDVNISVNDFKALQNKPIQKALGRIIDPLKKEDTNVEEITFEDSNENIAEINKENYSYLDDAELFQVIPEMTYKGFVSKIDTKALTGFLNIGSKRFSFSYSKKLVKEQFDILIESLRNRVQIIVKGEVTMDYESNPKSMQVVEVSHDVKLFD